jgi:hypothetical protein
MPKQKRYFYDTEFKEDGSTIDLISFGMVCEDGREFYAVSNEFDTYRVATDQWLMENVMSSIGHEVIHTEGRSQPVGLKITDPAVMSRVQIRDALLDFVDGTWPDFWAWYGAYDHVVMCQLFGRMIDLPKRFPMFTSDLRQTIKDKGIAQRELPEQPDGHHNALDDARWLKVRYEFVQNFVASVKV